MKNLLALIAVLIPLHLVVAQEEALGKIIDDLTYTWDLEAKSIEKYEGFSKFCTNKEYREQIVRLLKDIHHYDSVLYDRLKKAAQFGTHNHEVKKTIADIEKFEKEYDMKSFLKFLQQECHARAEIEKHRKELETEVGDESYDGKIYILQNEIVKYVHHITKRVDTIRDHVHHLHIK
jgi:hypothetical protein